MSPMTINRRNRLDRRWFIIMDILNYDIDFQKISCLGDNAISNGNRETSKWQHCNRQWEPDRFRSTFDIESVINMTYLMFQVHHLYKNLKFVFSRPEAPPTYDESIIVDDPVEYRQKSAPYYQQPYNGGRPSYNYAVDAKNSCDTSTTQVWCEKKPSLLNLKLFQVVRLIFCTIALFSMHFVSSIPPR